VTDQELDEHWYLYTRKSRALDPDTISEEELFRKHKEALFRLAQEKGMPGDLEAQFQQEIGSSETIDGRPVFRDILKAINALPYPCRVHLIVMDQDRVSRAEGKEMFDILDRLRARGTILHQVIGGDIDLTDEDQYTLSAFKGLFNRWTIQKYKQKKKDACDIQLKNGEIRQGQVPFGLWWDKSEAKARDRAKKDDREESRDWHPSEKGYGLTPWEKMEGIWQDVLFISLRQLAVQYHVSLDTLYSVFESPTIVGWPVTRTAPVPELDELGNKTGRDLRTAQGQVVRRKLPRDKWIWPDKEGTYPKIGNLQEWFERDEIINGRQHGKVKSHCGVGIAKDVVRIEGCEGMVLLGRKGGNARKGWEGIATYRQLATPDAENQKGSRDVPRDLVDAAAIAAVKALVSDATFFAWAIRDYYRDRKEAEPEDADRQMLEINRQLAKLHQDHEKARQWAYSAESETEAAGYRQDARTFLGLIAEKEKEKATLKAARSPIPAVDNAIPCLVALSEQVPPAFWLERWEQVWAWFTPEEQRGIVNMCIAIIPVLYQPPTGAESGKPSGWYRGKAQRMVLPVQYTPYWQEAQAKWTEARMSACGITSRP
jgi:hypothetical protein